MFHRLRAAALAVLIVFAAAPPAAAGFDEAVAAFNRGDYTDAAREFRALAEQGHVGAQYNLAVLYGRGLGVHLDDAQAVRWYTRAAAQGHGGAQYNLGVRYAKGLGVPRDDVRAYEWLSLAAPRLPAGRYRTRALMTRDRVAQRMSDAAVAEAERRAAAWTPTTEAPAKAPAQGEGAAKGDAPKAQPKAD